MDHTETLFKKAGDHLLRQNAKSLFVDQDGLTNRTCAYRGKGGLSCAIGGLISDEFYDPALELRETDHDLVVYALCKSNGIDETDVDWEALRTLQFIHDQFVPEDWPHQLNAAAKEHNFTVRF
jgi:hypothetical protein